MTNGGSPIDGATEPQQTPVEVVTLPGDLHRSLPVMILRHGDHDDPLVPEPLGR